MSCKEYITSGDNSKGKVVSHGTIWVNESFVLKDVALVSNLHFNLLSISQLFGDVFEVRFKKAYHEFLILRGVLFVGLPHLAESFKLIFHTLLALLDVWWPNLP